MWHQSGADSDEQTLLYLQQLHNLFERGIFFHRRVYQMDSSILNRMQEGYKYFSEWRTSLQGMHSFLMAQYVYKVCMHIPSHIQLSTTIKSCLLYICPIYADSTNDSTETDDAIEADDSASSVKIDLKHNFLAWQVSTCMCVTRD